MSDEVIVRFRLPSDRDTVMGAAAALATFMDERGRATAGLRMEVPPPLAQDFKILFKYGKNLRLRHGQGTRRHIKFDDASGGLYLNVRLPGDDGWSRVSTDLARRGVRARQMLTDDELERRLDITGPISGRPRAGSLQHQPMDEDVNLQRRGPAAAWTERRSGSLSSA